MTVDKTEGRATNQNRTVEGMGHRINQECKLLHLPPNHPETPPGMEGKCMRCGKPEHQQGQKCAVKNAKCKECHKIGHFYKVCQFKKKTRRANLAQATPQA